MFTIFRRKYYNGLEERLNKQQEEINQEKKEILQGKRCFYCGTPIQEAHRCSIDAVGIDTKERREKYKNIFCCPKCDGGIEHWLRMYRIDTEFAYMTHVNDRDTQFTIAKKFNNGIFKDRYYMFIDIHNEDYIIKNMQHENGINIFDKIREYLKKENKEIWCKADI